MGRILLFLLAGWVLLSLLGLLIKGLFWLFVVGIVLVVATAGLSWLNRST